MEWAVRRPEFRSDTAGQARRPAVTLAEYGIQTLKNELFLQRSGDERAGDYAGQNLSLGRHLKQVRAPTSPVWRERFCVQRS